MHNTTKPSYPSPHQFIEAWQASSTLAEVAARLGISKSICSVRACRYRKEGVPLKQFPALKLERYNWRALAQHAAQLAAHPTAPELPIDTAEPATGAHPSD